MGTARGPVFTEAIDTSDVASFLTQRQTIRAAWRGRRSRRRLRRRWRGGGRRPLAVRLAGCARGPSGACSSRCARRAGWRHPRSRGALRRSASSIQQHGPFGHDNDRGRRSRVMTALDLLRQVGEIGWVLGEAERVRTRSNPGAHRPATPSFRPMTSTTMKQVMALTGRLNPVDRLRRGRRRSVETDTALGPRRCRSSSAMPTIGTPISAR